MDRPLVSATIPIQLPHQLKARVEPFRDETRLFMQNTGGKEDTELSREGLTLSGENYLSNTLDTVSLLEILQCGVLMLRSEEMHLLQCEPLGNSRCARIPSHQRRAHQGWAQPPDLSNSRNFRMASASLFSEATSNRTRA
jgi:hypothetical protein